MIFTRHFGALAARPTFSDAREVEALDDLKPGHVKASGAERQEAA